MSPGMITTATPCLAMAVRMAIPSTRGICSGCETNSQEWLQLALTLRGNVGIQHAERTAVLAMYWHFVDVVWVVVFVVVYVIGR